MRWSGPGDRGWSDWGQSADSFWRDSVSVVDGVCGREGSSKIQRVGACHPPRQRSQVGIWGMWRRKVKGQGGIGMEIFQKRQNLGTGAHPCNPC